MNFHNVEILETKDALSVVRLDFHHTRGDTTVYAIVDRRGIVEDRPINEDCARFYLTMRVASLALEQCAVPSSSMTEVKGPITGKSYEQMLAFLER